MLALKVNPDKEITIEKNSNRQPRPLLVVMATAALLVAAPLMAADDTAATDNSFSLYVSDSFSPYVDTAGNISRPENFRRDWVHLGSWFVKEDDHASGPGVHDVYANPKAVDAFRKTGQWQDGAVLVKEIRGIERKTLTTGDARWAGDVGVWFVMVRDRDNRFPENPGWGEGWGWALFKADNPGKNTTTTWKGEGFNNCFGCHIPAQSTEWVFIDGYPTIRNTAKYPGATQK